MDNTFSMARVIDPRTTLMSTVLENDRNPSDSKKGFFCQKENGKFDKKERISRLSKALVDNINRLTPQFKAVYVHKPDQEVLRLDKTNAFYTIEVYNANCNYEGYIKPIIRLGADGLPSINYKFAFASVGCKHISPRKNGVDCQLQQLARYGNKFVLLASYNADFTFKYIVLINLAKLIDWHQNEYSKTNPVGFKGQGFGYKEYKVLLEENRKDVFYPLYGETQLIADSANW